MLSEAKYQECLRKLEAGATEYMTNEFRSGATKAQDAPFSGEYADGLTLQKVLDLVGQPAMVEELTPEEEQDFMQAWEDSYFEAWQLLEEERAEDFRDYMAESEGLVLPSYAS